MVGFEDGDIAEGWSDGVVKFACKVVTVGWVAFEVFVLIIMGEVVWFVGTVGWAVVVVALFRVVGTVVEFVLVTEVALMFDRKVEAVFEVSLVVATSVVTVTLA